MSKSKRVGQIKGDFLILEKLVKNKRSYYKVQCQVCGDISYTYNITDKVLVHSDIKCKNTTVQNIIGFEINDFKVIDARYNKRLMLDVQCKICGAIRHNVAKKDFDIHSNRHGAICTIKATNKYPNKKIVKKLIRGYQNCRMRVLLSETNDKYRNYQGIEFGYKNTSEFVEDIYASIEQLVNEGVSLEKISLDRIDNTKGYIIGNVRGAIGKTQATNKRNSYIYYLDNVEIDRDVLLSQLDIYQQKLSRLFGNNDEFEYNNHIITRRLKYK